MKNLCSGWRNPWSLINGFWSGHPREFKNGYYCDFSAEEALYNI